MVAMWQLLQFSRILFAADQSTAISDNPSGLVGQMTVTGCLIWVVWFLNSKTLPAQQKQSTAMMETMHVTQAATLKDMLAQHGRTIEIIQAQATAASDIARNHFLQALEASQKQSAEERKEAMAVVQALQKEYIQQVEFQRKQCTEEHSAKDRLLERLMERAGMPKIAGADGGGVIH